jgi:hypothetical protein
VGITGKIGKKSSRTGAALAHFGTQLFQDGTIAPAASSFRAAFPPSDPDIAFSGRDCQRSRRDRPYALRRFARLAVEALQDACKRAAAAIGPGGQMRLAHLPNTHAHRIRRRSRN